MYLKNVWHWLNWFISSYSTKNWITACKIWPQINVLYSKLLLSDISQFNLFVYDLKSSHRNFKAVKYLKGNIHYIHSPQKALVKSAESISLRNFSEMKHMTVFDTYKPPIAMKRISVSLQCYLAIGVIKMANFSPQFPIKSYINLFLAITPHLYQNVNTAS